MLSNWLYLTFSQQSTCAEKCFVLITVTLQITYFSVFLLISAHYSNSARYDMATIEKLTPSCDRAKCVSFSSVIITIVWEMEILKRLCNWIPKAGFFSLVTWFRALNVGALFTFTHKRLHASYGWLDDLGHNRGKKRWRNENKADKSLRESIETCQRFFFHKVSLHQFTYLRPSLFF